MLSTAVDNKECRAKTKAFSTAILQPHNSNCDSTLVQTYVSAIFAAPKALVSWTDAGLLAAPGLEVYLAQLLFAEAYMCAPASLIAPSETEAAIGAKPSIKQ